MNFTNLYIPKSLIVISLQAYGLIQIRAQCCDLWL